MLFLTVYSDVILAGCLSVLVPELLSLTNETCKTFISVIEFVAFPNEQKNPDKCHV
jgi:hypothetical protein